MKDLDFDELDRAVNSLMGTMPEGQEKKPADEPQTLTIEPSLGDGDKPDFSHLASATPQPSNPTSPVPANPAPTPQSPLVPDSSPRSEPMPAPVGAIDEAVTSGVQGGATSEISTSKRKALPAARRGGRFMDVVHPSSDMKQTTPARPVSREGKEVAPSAPVSDEKGENVDTAATAEQASTPVEPVVTPAQPPSPASEWPDPLEMANFKAEEEKAPEEPAKDQQPDEPAPLTTPFLSDAKVEKRPLGTSATSSQEPESTRNEPTEERQPLQKEHTVIAAPESIETDETEEMASPATPMPEELRSDLMAIESGAQEEEEETASRKNQADKAESTHPTQGSSSEVAAAPGSTSIPQQYREAPSTGDQTNGAIYDTENYHQPLSHPAKKKSGWMWVVWILVILLLGAGGGAAVYYFTAL